jgi:hypothetical protein
MSIGRGGPSERLSKVQPTKAQDRALEKIRQEIASLGPCLPGSLVVRTGQCGKQACACHEPDGRLHGPFRSWTRKLGGKTVTRLLSEEQLGDYQEMFDNHRRLKELVHEIEELSVAIVERDPRWSR